MFQAHRPSSKKSLFPSIGHPKMKEKLALRPRSPKNITKLMQRVPKGSHRDAHGGPRGAPGLQNGSQILSKFLKKRGLCPGALQKGAKGTPGPPKIIKKRSLCPGAPPKGAKGTPGPPKISKIKRKLTRSRLHPSEKNCDSSAPHETSSEKGSRRLAAYIKQLSEHNSIAHT